MDPIDSSHPHIEHQSTSHSRSDPAKGTVRKGMCHYHLLFSLSADTLETIQMALHDGIKTERIST